MWFLAANGGVSEKIKVGGGWTTDERTTTLAACTTKALLTHLHYLGSRTRGRHGGDGWVEGVEGWVM